MTTTYFPTNGSTFTFGGFTFSPLGAVGSSASKSYSVATSASDVIQERWTTTADLGIGAGWSGGSSATYASTLDVTTCASTVTFRPHATRRSAAGATVGVAQFATAQTGTGIKSFSVSQNLDSGSPDPTDRPEWELRASNSSSMTAGALAFNVNDADTTFTAPWTIAAATARPQNIRASNPATPRSYTW